MTSFKLFNFKNVSSTLFVPNLTLSLQIKIAKPLTYQGFGYSLIPKAESEGGETHYNHAL